MPDTGPSGVASAAPHPLSPPRRPLSNPAAVAADLVGLYLGSENGSEAFLPSFDGDGAGPVPSLQPRRAGAPFQSSSSFGRLRGASSRASLAAASTPTSPTPVDDLTGAASTLTTPAWSGEGAAVAAGDPPPDPRAVAAARTIQRAVRAHLAALAATALPFSKHGAQARDLVQRYVAVLQAAALAKAGGPGAVSTSTTADPTAPFLEASFASRARLVLHFDVNKTVVMADGVQGAGTGHIVNMLLAECAWGRLEAGPAWVPVGRLAADRPAGDPQLMTYRSFLDSFLLPTGGEGRGEGGEGVPVPPPPAAALAAAAAALGLPPPTPGTPHPAFKDARQALKRTFTDPGQPGAMFRSIYDRLVSTLEPCSGRHQVLHSFFNLLLHLKAAKREFAIVFRSFGTDLASVLAEVDSFARGTHPAYPGVVMDGSDGGPDLRATPGGVGVFFRDSARPNGTALLFGPGAAPFMGRRGGLSLADLEGAAAAGDGDTRLLRGFGAIHAALQAATCAPCRSNGGDGGEAPSAAPASSSLLALRDHYPYWKARQERSRAGKLFLVDATDIASCIQVFFDDNVGHGGAHIIDARAAATGAPLSFPDVAGTHVVRVEPLNAVLDPHYFVRAVHECVLGVMRRREGGGAGGGGVRPAAVPTMSEGCGAPDVLPPSPPSPAPVAPSPSLPALPISIAGGTGETGPAAADLPARPRPRVTLGSTLSAVAALEAKLTESARAVTAAAAPPPGPPPRAAHASARGLVLWGILRRRLLPVVRLSLAAQAHEGAD